MPDLQEFHGTNRRGRRTIYVILSKDGSTVRKDPGLDRPWSTVNRKYAEEVAKKCDGVAVDLITACNAIVRHPKNLPKNVPPPPNLL